MIEMNDRLMLYIDILGFSNFITETPPVELKEKLEIYEQIFYKYMQDESFVVVEQNDPFLVERFPRTKTYSNQPQSIVISDSFLISYTELMPEKFTEGQPDRFKEGMRKRSLINFTDMACDIQKDIMTSFGLLVRGIIHVGPLHHEGNLIVGKGFVEAVKLEKEKRYPAIYLSSAVCERWRQEIDSALKHYTKRTKYRKDGEETYLFPAKLCEKENKLVIDEIIEKGLKDAPDCKAREKWKWIKRERASYFGTNSL